MKKIVFRTVATSLLMILFSMVVTAQKKNVFNTDQLAITITNITNNYQNTSQPLSQFVLINNSKTALPATGWKIYFNNKSNVKLEKENEGLSLQKQKGNLFQLAPTTGFKAIVPGKNITAQWLIEDKIINRNDQPEGFYLVWDTDPNRGYDIKNLTINPLPVEAVNGKLASDFAATVYQRNALINTETIKGLPKVFPTPVSYSETSGSFQLTGNTVIVAAAAYQKEANLLADELQQLLDKKPAVSSTGKGITLKMKEGLAAEGYELNINAGETVISATTAAGIFYGIQSFKTLLPAAAWGKKNKSVTLPAANVSDAPRFGYRGFMLDVARNFQTKEEVLRILDLMALYKLNTFHFHITEDEGWRLEIDGLPELTAVGANRGHSLDEKHNMPSAYGSGAVTGKLYGSGFYTKADFIEILKYANDRHIKVIPEIETPGHARAAIKAMDARYEKFMQQGRREEALQYFLRDTLDESVYNTPQWFHDNVICVALPSVYTFIEKVVTEVDKIYHEAGVPLTSIHFGGDEVPAGTWEKSPACNALIKTDPSLNNTNDLWYYYLNKVNNILQTKGIALSGWEEIGLRKTEQDGKKIMIPNPGFVNKDMRLYVWNNLDGNEDLAYKLANSGYKIVLTCVTNFYFDMIQFKTYDEPGYYWGSITDIGKAYEFIPFDYFKNVSQDSHGNPIDRSMFLYKQRLTDYGKENVLGLQAAIWSETIKGPKQLEYMLLPRLAALSERAWAKDPEWANETDTGKMRPGYIKAWSSFVQSVGNTQLPLLDKYNGGYNYRIPPAGAVIENGAVVANTQFPGLTIRYTVNGAEPINTSTIYNGAIANKAVIKLKVFNNAGRESYVTVIENK